MTKYYSGKIINNSISNFDDAKLIISFIVYKDQTSNPGTSTNNNEEKYFISDATSKNALKYFRLLPNKDVKKLYDDLRKIVSNRCPDEIMKEYDDLFVKLAKFDTRIISSNYAICYKKLYDQDGNEYAKELYTEEIFPIINNYNNFDLKYTELNDKRRKCFYDAKKGIRYILRSGTADVLETNDNKTYFIYGSDKTRLEKSLEGNPLTVNIKDNPLVLIPCREESFVVDISPSLIFPNKKIEYFIVNDQLASENDVERYYKRYHGFRRGKAKRKYVNKITEFSKSNYLGENIKYSTYNGRAQENVVTSEMQELDFLLTKLKNISKELYKELYEEYQEIFNRKANNTDIDEEIRKLKNKVKINIICGGNNNEFKKYLIDQINGYIDRLYNKSLRRDGLTIKDIDLVINNFLTSKTSMDYKEQNDILKYISLLYFFEINENLDVIDPHKLKDSYVIDNIKRIVVGISVLHDENIIVSMPNNLFDITNIDELLRFMKDIEFNDNNVDKNKEFIKKMQL